MGGGIPFVIDGRLVEAAGVSVSTVSNDIIVASAAIQVFERWILELGCFSDSLDTLSFFSCLFGANRF
nr:hypothetical protein [Cytobacillus firmus]